MINLRSALLNKVINRSTKFLLENDYNRNKNEKKKVKFSFGYTSALFGTCFLK